MPAITIRLPKFISIGNPVIDLRSGRSGSPRADILSGLTVALALVPEAVAFAFLAGVPPLVGLYAAFIICLLTSFLGGRPGMISGATGAMGVVIVSVDAEAVGISGGLPRPAWWDFTMPPATFATLWIILPYAMILAGVGLIESLMTLTLIDELTETRGRSNRECVGQGVANVACGILAERYQKLGKRLHLRHLSEDCRRLSDKAGELVEVNISEDPHYHVATERTG